MKFKGIIFDFNGVLLWDSHLHVQAWQQFALKLRGYEFDNNELSIHVHGRTNSHILSYLTGRALQSQELSELIQMKETVYRNLCLSQGKLFALSPGATDLLDFLAKNNIPRTIATASEKTNLDFFITHLSLKQWFDINLIVYDDGQLPGKPLPDIYLKAASNLGLPPQECIVVEDAISGIQSAHAANIGHIIALGHQAMHQQLKACAGVSAVVESLEQLSKESLFSV
jgi:beta-phosphoglucomutase-like phosphatase (HAD superfamily)